MAKSSADLPKESTKDLASQMMEAEVAFWLQNLKGKKFQALLADEIGHVLERFKDIKLRDAVDENKVKVTARRYAVEMEIGGAIPELFGEIANRIFEFPASRNTKIGEVVSDSIATEYIEKIFEQDGVLDHAVTNIRNSAPFRNFLSDVIFTVLKGYVFEQNNLMKFTPVASSTRKVREWLSSKAPDLSEGLEDRVRNLMETGVKSSLEMVDETLDNEQYRENAMNSALGFWDVVREWPLTAYRDYLSEQDLQEFMVLGYEFWLEFRNTEYLKSCIDLGVEFFFEKYGEQSLQDLLDDIGVSHEMILDEIDHYIPDLAILLIKEGLAESFLRRNLQRFYSSKKVQDLLAT